MKNSNLVNLNLSLNKLKQPFAFIENSVANKNVLNVGAAGGIQGYLPHNKQLWLHEKIRVKATKLTGIDIDEAAIDYAQKHGYEILKQNCETMDLGEKFDVIIMSDVIEHVDSPVAAISNLAKNHLSDNGFFIITTPNATAGNILIRSLLRKKLRILNEHVAVFYPENFKVICDKLGIELTAVFMFDHTDRRSRLIHLKSMLFKLMSCISPRLASSILVVI